MKIIDYTPGGLGNFIGQIFSNSISTSGHLSFHRNQGNYGTELVTHQHIFAERAPNWIPSTPVNICHSWGQLDLISYRPIEKWQVYVDQQHLYLFYNFYLKAHATFIKLPEDHWHKQSAKSQSDHKILPSRKWATGIMHNLYHKWPTKPNSAADKLIRFDDFYDSKQSFFNVVQSLNPTLSLTLDEIWNIWTTSQQPIFDAVNRVRSRSNLTEIDLGVVDYLDSMPKL